MGRVTFELLPSNYESGGLKYRKINFMNVAQTLMGGDSCKILAFNYGFCLKLEKIKFIGKGVTNTRGMCWKRFWLWNKSIVGMGKGYERGIRV